jgi:hypothetical protein
MRGEMYLPIMMQRMVRTCNIMLVYLLVMPLNNQHFPSLSISNNSIQHSYLKADY